MTIDLDRKVAIQLRNNVDAHVIAAILKPKALRCRHKHLAIHVEMQKITEENTLACISIDAPD